MISCENRKNSHIPETSYTPKMTLEFRWTVKQPQPHEAADHQIGKSDLNLNYATLIAFRRNHQLGDPWPFVRTKVLLPAPS